MATTTTPENVPSWRDLRDQLTPGQVAELAHCEHEVRGYTPRVLLCVARRYATDNASDAFYGGAPLPAGATACPWQGDEPQAYRYVRGADRRVDGHNLVVYTTAVQRQGGTIDAEDPAECAAVRIENINYDDGLTLAQARQLASVLAEAADEIEGWTV
jgi:hypothetical protein